MITRILTLLALLSGLAVILWTGTTFINQSQLAFLVTLAIALAFIVGAVEMLMYQKATRSLANQLLNTDAEPEDIEQWLQSFDRSLYSAVKNRICNERVALPLPSLTPYLTGLLVMLGLLGTFIGMVEMLKGAVNALEGTSELDAVRAGLAAPISGLGLAFGTSVSGVAASAALGLVSTLSRRDRIATTRLLDKVASKYLSVFSLGKRQDDAFSALTAQAEFIPKVAEQLLKITESLDKNTAALSDRLLENQQAFFEQSSEQFSELNRSIQHSLDRQLSDNSAVITEQVAPVIDDFSKRIVSKVEEITSQIVSTSDEQLKLQRTQFEGISHELNSAWQAAAKTLETRHQENLTASAEKIAGAADTMLSKSLVAHEESFSRMTQLIERVEEVQSSREQADEAWQSHQRNQFTELQSEFSQQLSRLREQEQTHAAQLVQQIEGLQAVASQHLEQLGVAIEKPMLELIETASKTPKVAAEVIGELRSEVAKSVARDTEIVEERMALIKDLHALRTAINDDSVAQQTALSELMRNSLTALNKSSEQLSSHAESERDSLQNLSVDVAANTAELSVVAETLSAAVIQYGEVNTQLAEHLHKVDAALESSAARSDEQMNYYVAQAREIIDHTLLSHQQLVDQLRKLNALSGAVEES